MTSTFGVSLIDLRCSAQERAEVWGRLHELHSLQLSARALCNLESIATGVFSPLSRFMGQNRYSREIEEMRLEDGCLFPIPVTLAVEDLEGIRLDQEIALRSATNNVVGWMRVEEIFERNVEAESRQVWGSKLDDLEFAVEIEASARYCLSGPLLAIDRTHYSAFPELQRTPAELRELLRKTGNRNVIAFPVTTTIHASKQESIIQAAKAAKGNAVGSTGGFRM